jgi:ferredoxin-type protein NapH
LTRRQRIRRAIIIVSFLFFPVTMWYFSPVQPIMGAAQGIVAGSLIVFGLLFLSALVLGRAWCGWACPGAGLTETCFLVRDNKAKGGRWNWIKWFLWVPWLGTIVFFSIKSGGFSAVDPWFQTTYGVSVAKPGHFIVFYGFVGLIVVLSLTAGRRAFCHYVCWMAPFMVIGSKVQGVFGWPALHLAADKARCSACKTCNDLCPMSLNVMKMVHRDSMTEAECNLCGTCVDNCPEGVIRFAFSRSR